MASFSSLPIWKRLNKINTEIIFEMGQLEPNHIQKDAHCCWCENEDEGHQSDAFAQQKRFKTVPGDHSNIKKVADIDHETKNLNKKYRILADFRLCLSIQPSSYFSWHWSRKSGTGCTSYQTDGIKFRYRWLDWLVTSKSHLKHVRVSKGVRWGSKCLQIQSHKTARVRSSLSFMNFEA